MQSLGEITAGIGERAGLTLLIGEPGIGKTVLLHRLESALAADGIPACHFSRPVASLTELAVACGGAAGPGAALPDDDTLARLLIDTLASRLGPGGTAAVLADEAHAIPPDCLARLCRLAELSNEAGGVLQILLTGHPSLAEAVAGMPGRAATGAEVRCVRLAPLAPAEVAAYIRYRLGFVRYIGPDLFPGPAMTRVAAHSRGNPSRINRLCSAALLTAFLDGAKTVTAAVVDRAAAEGLIDGPPQPAPADAPGPRGPAATDGALDSVLAAIARLQQAGALEPAPEPRSAHRDRHAAAPPPSPKPSPKPSPELQPEEVGRADAPTPAEHVVSVRDATRQARGDRWFRGSGGRPAPASWRVWDRPGGGAGRPLPVPCGPRLPAVHRGAPLPVVADPPSPPPRGRPFPVPRPSRRTAAATAALIIAAVALGSLGSMGGGSAPPEAPPAPPAAPQAAASAAVRPEPVAPAASAAPAVPHADPAAAAPPVSPGARPAAPPVDGPPQRPPAADPLRLLGAGDAAAWSGPAASGAGVPDRNGAATMRFDPAGLYPDRGFAREEDGFRLMPTEEGLRLIARTRPAPRRARPPPAQSAEAPPPPPPERGDCPGPRPRVPPHADMSLGEFIDSFVDDVGRLGECVF